MQEVAPLAIGAAGLIREGQAFLGFVLVIGLLVLPQLLDTVCELAFVVVLAVSGLKVIAAEFVLELVVAGRCSGALFVAFAGVQQLGRAALVSRVALHFDHSNIM